MDNRFGFLSPLISGCLFSRSLLVSLPFLISHGFSCVYSISKHFSFVFSVFSLSLSDDLSRFHSLERVHSSPHFMNKFSFNFPKLITFLSVFPHTHKHTIEFTTTQRAWVSLNCLRSFVSIQYFLYTHAVRPAVTAWTWGVAWPSQLWVRNDETYVCVYVCGGAGSPPPPTNQPVLRTLHGILRVFLG